MTALICAGHSSWLSSQGILGVKLVTLKIFDDLAALGDGGLLHDLTKCGDGLRFSVKLWAADNIYWQIVAYSEEVGSNENAKEPLTLFE